MPLALRRLAPLIAIFALALTTSADRIATTLLEAVPTPTGPMDVEAVAFDIDVAGPDGELAASIVAFAYLDPEPSPDRPVIFFFNGGPGAATAFLHVGFAAPFRATLLPGADDLGQLNANPLTLVDVADLVFVDPVGAGFSRPDEPDNTAFYSLIEDALTNARFADALLDEIDRDDAPVYLAGESYGGPRVAIMAMPMLDADIDLRGLIMISPALDTAILRSSHRPALRSADLAPSIAALAVQRGWLATNDKHAFAQRARRFASTVYLPALEQLDELDDRLRRTVAETLELYTTIDADEALAIDLHLPRDEVRKVIGRGAAAHDARLAGADTFGGISMNALTGALKAVLRRVWNIDTQDQYILMNRDANRRWRGLSGEDHFMREPFQTAPFVAHAHARAGERFRLFVASGWYDLVTPFASAHRIKAEGGFGRCNVTIADYAAGHVIYADDDAFEALTSDLRAWLQRAPAPDAR